MEAVASKEVFKLSMYGKFGDTTINRPYIIRFKVSGMNSRYDFAIIFRELMKLEGIETVGPYFHNNILIVNYYPHIINIETIIYTISKLGYRLFSNKVENKSLKLNSGG